MDQMQSLPYEILQLIAESLLPRYQCSLTMTSRWCYQWLYNDLLKWHARKQHIPVPKYIYDGRDARNLEVSRYTLDGKTIIYEYDSRFNELEIYDLAKNLTHHCGEYECMAYGTPIRVLYGMNHIKLNSRPDNIDNK